MNVFRNKNKVFFSENQTDLAKRKVITKLLNQKRIFHNNSIKNSLVKINSHLGRTSLNFNTFVQEINIQPNVWQT